jgi:hypothetical protein
MKSPTRLRDSDDPLAAALEVEAQDAQHLAVAPLRHRVVAAVDAGASPWTEASTTGLASHAVVLAVGLALGAVGHAGWATSTPAVSVPAPLPLAATTAATAPSSPPTSTLPSPQPVPRAAAKAPSPLPVPSPVPPPLPSTPAPPAPSTLAEELKLYERAQGALEEGRAALAVVEFRRYRSLYPRGRLRADADAGLIKALTLAGRLEEAQDEVDAARTAPP